MWSQACITAEFRGFIRAFLASIIGNKSGISLFPPYKVYRQVLNRTAMSFFKAIENSIVKVVSPYLSSLDMKYTIFGLGSAGILNSPWTIIDWEYSRDKSYKYYWQVNLHIVVQPTSFNGRKRQWKKENRFERFNHSSTAKVYLNGDLSPSIIIIGLIFHGFVHRVCVKTYSFRHVLSMLHLEKTFSIQYCN